MIRKLFYLIAFMFMAESCFGVLLFKDDFSSPIDHDPAKAQIKVPSLDYKFQSEAGGRLWLKNYYGTGISYKLSNSIKNHSTNPTLYISYSLKSLNESNSNKFAGVIFYNNGQEVFGTGNDFGSENFSYWGSGLTDSPIGEVKSVIDNEIHKIVVKITFNADGPEDIKIGLDPFCRRSEQRQPDNIWSKCQTELEFDEIRFRCGNDNCNWEFDELRIATDWASVTPSNNSPGSDYIVYLNNSLPNGDAEMISDNTARFWPNEVSSADVLPSMALTSPAVKTGEVADNWQTKPLFGTFDGKKYAYFNIPAETDLYGTGEVTGGLLRNGYKIRLFNKDNGAYSEPDRLYQSHPWVMGVRPDGTAFGIIFDTTWIAELNLRAGILFTVPEHAPSFPVIVIEEPNPQQLMVKLAELTGSMPMPPRWALGYQQCRFSYVPDSRAREVADTFRNKEIPCDVIWFDIDYMDGFRIFTFSPNNYPDPTATNDYLHSKGFKGIWMIDPGVKREPGYFVYDSGSAVDAWVKDANGNEFFGPVWPGDSVFPDFTSPEVSNWWAGLYKDFMGKHIDGVWNDMNEPTVFGLDHMTMPMDNQFRGGGDLLPGTHEQYHNTYGMLMTKASRQGIQEANPNKRPFVLTRSNYLGGQRYAATWTGDNLSCWQHLEWSIPMSLNLSLSGQPFNGPDIGGFLGDATPELFGHWISVGAFYPFSRAHTCAGTIDHEPWSFGQEVEESSRIALQRRYRLMPYLYTIFEESHKTGMPVMRPTFFADPSNVSLRKEQQSFLLGKDLMITPRWAENTAQPSGIWQDVTFVGEDLEKDQYQCRMQQRGGSIIPLGPIVQSTDAISTIQDLTLYIVLDENGKANGSLYEDAGDGYEFQAGQFCISEYTAQLNDDTVTVKCTAQNGELAQSSRTVTAAVITNDGIYYGRGDICGNNGVSVKVKLSAKWKHQDIGTVSITGGCSGTDSSLTISGAGDDIEGNSDEFHFSYKQLSGDCELSARIVSQQPTDNWAKAGVMMRNSLMPNSAHAMVVITPENGAAFQCRSSVDNYTAHTGIGGLRAPIWVKVKKSSNIIIGYYSQNGTDWTEIDSAAIEMNDTYFAGLAVTSHNDTTTSTVYANDIKTVIDYSSVDTNNDDMVNLTDFYNIAADWYCTGDSVAGDINNDNIVDYEDLCQMSYYWLLKSNK